MCAFPIFGLTLQICPQYAVFLDYHLSHLCIAQDAENYKMERVGPQEGS